LTATAVPGLSDAAPTNATDEMALIRAARQGSVESFNTLVLTYQTGIYNLAYRLTGDPDAAADATQEAFISAYRNLTQFHDGSFRAWLSRIATNACYDELRRRQRRPTVSLDDPAAAVRWASAAESPESAVQRAELNRAIQDCLAGLPDDQRAVVVLCDVQGFDYQEIATITGQALGTVKSRLSRARGRLRDCLSAVRELLPDLHRPDQEQSEPKQ
jgi:RNA polymerase sigma factor (sigma-70 family)